VHDKVIVGINGGHNSAIAVWNKGEFFVIEMERLLIIKIFHGVHLI